MYKWVSLLITSGSFTVADSSSVSHNHPSTVNLGKMWGWKMHSDFWSDKLQDAILYTIVYMRESATFALDTFMPESFLCTYKGCGTVWLTDIIITAAIFTVRLSWVMSWAIPPHHVAQTSPPPSSLSTSTDSSSTTSRVITVASRPQQHRHWAHGRSSRWALSDKISMSREGRSQRGWHFHINI